MSLSTLIPRIEQAGVDEQRECYDQTGRAIKVGDVLKVFHFQGARWRKRYFGFKQVVGSYQFKDGTTALKVSHLNMKDWGERDAGYTLVCDGTVYRDIEIVQGLDWHHDRPRNAAICRAHVKEGEDGR